jgi:putative sterol carrier protein
MTYFKDEQEVYDTIGKLFEQLAGDDDMAPKFRQADTIVQYAYSDPDSLITVCLRESEPTVVDFGATEMDPEVTLSMKADVAHRFWLGKVNVTMAIARGEIKPQGPAAKILRLVPLTKPAFPRYRAMLERQGRADLIDL